MNRPTAQTFGNDVSLLWLLKNSKTVYRSVLAAAEADTSGGGLTTAEQAMSDYAELQSLVLETANTLLKTRLSWKPSKTLRSST